MQFYSESTADGVVERSFAVAEVPGVLWSPASASTAAPLVLMGHGGGLHKTAPGLVARARNLVTDYGFHAAAIDAPGHGDRMRNDEDARWVEAMLAAREAGDSITSIVSDFNRSLARRAVPEWRATLDVLLALPEIESGVGVGYTGMTLATAIGVPLAAADPRIAVAVFGGFFGTDWMLEAARHVTMPVEFILSWDDAELDRESGLALFDAFASPEKSLRAHPGSHFHVPESQADESTRFLARHLLGR